jgi:putative transposase
VNGMLQNRRLARAIADVGMHEFGRQVQYKATWNGSEVVVADRWYPSSKRCSECGAIKETLDLSERTYACTCCGASLDRDLNAARNLAQLATDRPNSCQGSQSTASSAGSNACGEDVRPASSGQTSMMQEPNRSLGSA